MLSNPGLAKEGRVQSDLPAYFATWSAEIASRASRVRLLIGSRHWLSDGTHKEFLVREFLARHLPNHLLVGRGFIRSLTSDEVSREVDVMVANPVLHTPIFNEGGLLVVTPSSVLATMEVKSTYRKAVLGEALRNTLRARAVVNRSANVDRVWSAVLFATSEDDRPSIQQVAADVADLLKQPEIWVDAELASGTPADRRQSVPSVISILDHCLVLLDRDDASINHVRIRAFACGDTAAALAFAQLFTFVRALMSSGSQPGELDEMLEQLRFEDYQLSKVAIP